MLWFNLKTKELKLYIIFPIGKFIKKNWLNGTISLQLEIILVIDLDWFILIFLGKIELQDTEVYFLFLPSPKITGD